MSNKQGLAEDKSQLIEEPSFIYETKASKAISTYQMQILECIANVKDEEEMKDIRNLIAEYFSNKALDAMDKLCDEGNLSTKEIESWNKEHLMASAKTS